MQSKNWYFNKTLFAKNLTRFWPIWAVYAAIWALLLPIAQFVTYLNEVKYNHEGSVQRLVDRMLEFTGTAGVTMAFFFGVLAAVAVFSYLNNSRSTGLMHTLPIRREGLFLTNWLSGYSFLLLPHIVIALATLAVQAVAGAVNGGAILMWLLIQSGTCFFFYTFAVFCAMFTGHVLAMPAFYVIFNFLAMGINLLVDALLTLFIFGYTGSSGISPLVEWLTPTAKLSQELYYRTVTENGVEVDLFTGFQYVLAYMGVALLLLLASLLLYRIRHMEAAGDVISFSWAKPIFKYGFALCAALTGGMLLYAMFSSLFDSLLLPLVVCTVVAGVVGCFMAEMFLQKSFKVFRKGWLSCGVFSLVMVGLLVGLNQDFLGLARWTPNPTQVEALSFDAHSLAPYDSAARGNHITNPATIEQVVALHQTIVDNRNRYEVNDTGLVQEWQYYSFDYILTDGSHVRRTYSMPILEEDPAQAQHLALVNSVDYLLDAYFPYDQYGATAVSGYLAAFDQRGNRVDRPLTATQAEAVAAAVRADVEAGRLGIHYLDDNDPQRLANCSQTDLELTWFWKEEPQANGYVVDRNTTVTITPQFTATSLMEALYDQGILNEDYTLLPHTAPGGPGSAELTQEADPFYASETPIVPQPTSTTVELS